VNRTTTTSTRPVVSGIPAAGAALDDLAVKHVGAHTNFDPGTSQADGAVARDSALLPRVEETRRRIAAARQRLHGIPSRWLLISILTLLLAGEIGASAFLMNRAGVEPPADWLLGALLALTLATAVALSVTLFRTHRRIGLLVLAATLGLCGAIGLMRSQEVDTGDAEDAPWLPYVTAIVMGATIVGIPVALHWIVTVLLDHGPDFDELKDAKAEHKELKERYDTGRAIVVERLESDRRYDEAIKVFKADMRATYPEHFPPNAN
jgi:hypothetical protein